MSTATYKCACCGNDFTARTADRARGWALYCGKRCKAIKQGERPDQRRAHQQRLQQPLPCRYNSMDEEMNAQALHDATGGWDDHKDWK